jgi:uncharacterized protein
MTGSLEVVIIGEKYEDLRSDFFAQYLPHRVLMSSAIENQEFPLTANKSAYQQTLIFLCKDFVCQQPVESISRFMSLINSAKKVN